MSRFNDEGAEWDYGRYMLWETAMGRALSSPRGQAALALMEEALLALPVKRLIYSALAKDGEVCAVGAYVLHRRVARGAAPDVVLEELEQYEGADDTASLGRAEGLAYSVAWRLGELNDVDFADCSPELRYERVLAWVRRAQGKP